MNVLNGDEKLIDIKELLIFAREQREMAKSIQSGINRLIESHQQMIGTQGHMIGLLDELKPLRSLPEISTNLTAVVNKLIEPATNPKRRVDVVTVFTICVLAFLLTIFVLKEKNFSGILDIFGNHAEIHSGETQKKTTQ